MVIKKTGSMSHEDMEYCMKIVLNTVTEGAMVADTDGTIMYYNNQMGLMEGFRARDVIGKKITEVYKVSQETSEHSIVMRTQTPILDRYQDYYSNKNQKITCVASTYPIMRNGELLATYSVSRSVNKVADLLKRTREIESSAGLNAISTENNTRYTFKNIITNSEKISSIIEKAKKFSKYNSNVLIFGETGVGKEIFAQGIHNYNSTNKRQPFVGINCSAIPDNLLESSLFGTVKGSYTGAENKIGLIEKAGFGTLFLDEINSMPLSLQAKMLRVIQEKKFRRIGSTEEISLNCRIISSTNISPERCLSENLIRKDLYYRISTSTLEIPPLRERKSDILPLINYFIEMYGSKYGLFNLQVTDDVYEILKGYSYPGNVRELENIIESAITLADDDQIVDVNCLPDRIYSESGTPTRKREGLGEYLRNAERDRIIEALEENDWNISRSAESLGIVRQNLQYRMKKLNIKKMKSHGNW
ncbi:arginine utilization regulatory protein [Dethiosulfatibacter aminovorans DSM 17477]|uniref:Arginine utilization regulatory protein n=1 Tax=Dethiosulfatibacter aminovorans DSM 17477 TaxID=1121476 RepID=A0A1M6AA98_9FIRM|nr:sigma 54-interacting transcriptional regulator [Dethiosulfatibacter aminovorans]SHI33093.1 arginine utilization regulatory protein [Dethiosulfatibacter aminovorans DSM 17477]